MPKTPKEILQEPYVRMLIPQESGRYYAKILEFPGCQAGGESLEEALRDLEDAATEWIESELEQGHSIPAPDQSNVYSGKFMVRTSPSLHQELVESADRQGISLNQYVVQKLSARVSEDRFANEILEKLKRPTKRN